MVLRAVLAAGATKDKNSAGWSARLAGKNENCFDAIRLLLATLVVFHHSFFLVQRQFDSEPLYLLTRGQTDAGALAVFMFFAISGFLVTRSWFLTGNLQQFLTKRLARIVPGFLVASFVASVVLAPLTARNVFSFFSDQNWPVVIVQALALQEVTVSGILDGYAVQLIHGTLWTVRIEFDCYLVVALLGVLGLLAPRRAWVVYLSLLLFGAAARAGWITLPVVDRGLAALLGSTPEQWQPLFPFFIAGSAFYIYREHVPKSARLFLLSLLILIASAVTGGMYWALLLCGTYVLIYSALSSSLEMTLFGRRIDLSYGVYLYGWPVAQLLIYFSHQSLRPVPLFVVTTAATAAVAYASWRFVEEPSLSLARRRNAAAAAA